MIKSLSNGFNSDLCIINQRMYNTEIFVMKCLDAISLSDQREVFQVELDFSLKQIDKYCLKNNKGKLFIDQCMYVNEKWIFDQQGRILNDANQKCVTLLDKKDKVEVDNASASSELEDMQHGPYHAIDLNQETFWATQEKNSYIQTYFNTPQTVSQIDIHWKYIPKSFEVQYLIENVWKTIKHVEDNVQAQFTLKFLPKVA